MKHHALLQTSLFPQRQQIYDSVINHPEVDHFNAPGIIHGGANSSWTTVDLARRLLPGYDDVIADCLLPCGLEFVAVRPNLICHTHKDDLNNKNGFARKTLLMIPLDYDDMAQCDYYDDSGSIVDSATPLPGMDYLHDTQAWHGFANGSRLRLTLEMGFNESFDTMLQIITERRLFKSHEVSFI